MAESTSDAFESNQQPLLPDGHPYHHPPNSSQTYQQTGFVPSSLLSSHEGQYVTESSSFDGSSYDSNDQQIASQSFINYPDHALLTGTASPYSNATDPSGHHFRDIPESSMQPFLNPIETQTLVSGHTTSGCSNYRIGDANILSEPGSWLRELQPFINPTDSGANHSTLSPDISTLGRLSSYVSPSPHNLGSVIDEFPSRNVPGDYIIDTDHRRSARHHTTHSSVRYFCIVCGNSSFRDKETWKRHQQCHYPETEFVCSPGGSVLSTLGDRICAFCDAKNPNAGHMAGHKAHGHQITFARKDFFVRHLKTCHNVSDARKHIEMWSSKPSARVLGCGFCIMTFNGTTSWLSHTAQHMEDGRTAADWDLCTVVHSLLSQSHVASDWQALLHGAFLEQNPPTIS